jgi:SAM-dependent methyltransferase
MVFGFQLITKLKSLLYDILISRFLTITAHVMMTNHIATLSGNFLDVGCGTGAPLQAVIPFLKSSYSKFVGVDLDHEYVLQAQRRFTGDKDVNIHEMNFYEINKTLKDKFNFILFSFSFMLMPNQVNAISVAKNSLEKDGRIGFIMTINSKENKLLEKIKPYIHRLTSIDFGNVTYQKQFEEILKIGEL